MDNKEITQILKSVKPLKKSMRQLRSEFQLKKLRRGEKASGFWNHMMWKTDKGFRKDSRKAGIKYYYKHRKEVLVQQKEYKKNKKSVK